MKAASYHHYGAPEVIDILDRPTPQPKRGEVLVRVQAAGLNPKDVLVRKGKFKRFTGRRFPQGVGFDFAGVIEEANGSAYRPGDRVFGMVNGWAGRCCAELLAVPADELAPLPTDLSFTAAAGVPLAAQTALQAIRDRGRLRAKQKICINGASGGVGTLAIQIAKALGGEVTAVSSHRNTELCRSLGADHLVDYTRTSPIDLPDRFAVFFDVFGNYDYHRVVHLLVPGGRYVTTVPKSAILFEQLRNPFRSRKAHLVVVKSNDRDMHLLAQWLRIGTLRPVVDRVFPLTEIREAQRYIETKRAKGKVIVQVSHLNTP